MVLEEFVRKSGMITLHRNIKENPSFGLEELVGKSVNI